MSITFAEASAELNSLDEEAESEVWGTLFCASFPTKSGIALVRYFYILLIADWKIYADFLAHRFMTVKTFFY